MEGAKKESLVLERLCCTSCSERIEREIRGLDGVAGVNLNFVDKTLVIDIGAGGRTEAVIEAARRVIKDIEPEIIITEKKVDQAARQIWLVMGLCCADCALKIEAAINGIAGVDRARVDFGRKELHLELADAAQAPRVYRESRQRARQVVKGVRFTSGEMASRRLRLAKRIALAAGLPLFALGLSNLWPAMSLPFYIAAYILFGVDVVWRAIRNIPKGKFFDENFLMTVATAGAFAVAAYPEAAAVMLFYKIGMMLEDAAVERSRRSIKSALALRPDTARLLTPTGERFVRPEEAAVGDLVRILPGERVPLDAEVVEGTSYVDSSLVSGEAEPILKATGDELFAGTVNSNGVLTARVTKAAADSMVAKILDFVEKANLKKSQAEHFIGKFTRVYTPLVVGAAALIAFVPLLFVGFAAWQTWLYRALIFLVISCPCALVLSIPLTFAAGIGGLARAGILVKGGRYLEALRRATLVVFDKTGTLTEHSFRVASVLPQPPFTVEELLSITAAAESFSAHPAAVAIRSAAGERGRTSEASTYDEIAGLGVKAVVAGRQVLAGNARLMEREGVAFEPAASTDTIVYVAVDGAFAGAIVIEEKVKDNARKAIDDLRRQGVERIAMLSGDREERARTVAIGLGISEIHAPLLPEEKVARFETLKAGLKRGRTVLAVGDGVNDAPLLARADVGAAMGALGREAAIEAADLVILDDDLAKLPLAVRLAKKTHRLVIENVILAFGIKALILILGAAGVATMWEAVFADVGVALLALANALRVLRPLK
jgi:Cd2+/Zn2+-exporting ATPase